MSRLWVGRTFAACPTDHEHTGGFTALTGAGQATRLPGVEPGADCLFHDVLPAGAWAAQPDRRKAH